MKITAHLRYASRVRRRPFAILALAAACAFSTSARRPSPADVVLARVDDAAAFETPAVRSALDNETLSIERAGNRAELLVNGEVAFARRFENARDAELILVKTFIFSDDEVGRQVADLLAERARAGAFVILQYDVKGSIAGAADVEDMLSRASTALPVGEKRIIRVLRDAGVVIVPTNSPARGVELREWGQNVDRLLRDPTGAVERSMLTLRLVDFCDHEKYWITGRRDAKGRLELRAILGGMNIASEYAYGGTTKVDAGSKRGGWRDTDVELAGPVVNDVVERFFEVMEHHLGEELAPEVRARWNVSQPEAGAARVRFVWNHPAAGNGRHIEHLYRILADATPRGGVVRLETAYYAPGKSMRRALKRALARGTRVTVLSNSGETNDISVVADASRFAYFALLQLDPTVALFERRARPDLGESTLHSKIASFGTRGPVIVGSANLDAQSSEHNSESVALIYDPELRRAFDAMFEQDMAADRADRITMDVIRRTSTWAWVKQWALYNLAWYWL